MRKSRKSFIHFRGYSILSIVIPESTGVESNTLLMGFGSGGIKNYLNSEDPIVTEKIAGC